jgi:hypothetical protein
MKLRTVLGLAAAVLVALVAITLVLGPRTPAARPLPAPNGYDDFLAAQKTISPAASDWHTLELAALENRTNAAALAALDCIRFGQESVRGGPLIDSLVGSAIRAIGLAQFNRVMHSADTGTLKQVAGTLETLLAARETAAEVTASEERFMRTFPLSQRLGGRIAAWTSGNQTTAKAIQKLDADHQQLARTMLDSAARAYELEHGSPPQAPTNLVPAYLKAVPQDPATGKPLPLLKVRP